MDMRITAAAPDAVVLSEVQLLDLAPGWTVSATTLDATLPPGGVAMQRSDVHTAIFHLQAPSASAHDGRAPLGTLRLRWRHADPQPGAPMRPGCDGGSDGGGEWYTLMHVLPPAVLCDSLATATLHAPPRLQVGAQGKLRLELRSGAEHAVLKVRATVDVSTGFKLVGEADAALEVAESGSVAHEWTITPLQAGACLLPVVVLECPQMQAMCRLMQQHVWVDSG